MGARLFNGCNPFQRGAKKCTTVQWGVKMPQSLGWLRFWWQALSLRQAVNISKVKTSLALFWFWCLSFSGEKVGAEHGIGHKIVGMSSDFQISVVKGFLEFHLPLTQQQPLEMILSVISRISPLPPSMRTDASGNSYAGAWLSQLSSLLLAFCICQAGILHICPAGILYFVQQLLVLRVELCPLYLICKVDAQVMGRDGTPR